MISKVVVKIIGTVDSDCVDDISDRISTSLHEILEEIEHEYGVETIVSFSHDDEYEEDEDA